MSNIDTVSPNNIFSTIEKKVLTTFIEVLSDKKTNIPKDKLKFIGVTLLGVGSIKGDADLVVWVLTNNYAQVTDRIQPVHISFANEMGLNIEELPTG